MDARQGQPVDRNHGLDPLAILGGAYASADRMRRSVACLAFIRWSTDVIGSAGSMGLRGASCTTWTKTLVSSPISGTIQKAAKSRRDSLSALPARRSPISTAYHCRRCGLDVAWLRRAWGLCLPRRDPQLPRHRRIPLSRRAPGKDSLRVKRKIAAWDDAISRPSSPQKNIRPIPLSRQGRVARRCPNVHASDRRLTATFDEPGGRATDYCVFRNGLATGQSPPLSKYWSQ